MSIHTSELEQAVWPQERGLQNALLAACGAVGFELDGEANGERGQAECARNIMGLPLASRVCVVLIDGMGYHQILARRGHIPTLSSLGLAHESSCITTVAPSTTAAALTSFATGLRPGETAMMSYSLWNRQSHAPFDLISFRGSPIPPDRWQTQPSIFERLDREQAQDCVLVVDPRYQGSGLTMAAWRGVRSVYGVSFEDRVQRAAHELRRGSKLAYLYWGNLDHNGHNHGVNSYEWISELEAVDAAISRLLQAVPAGTAVVITADHGMVHDRTKVDIANVPELNAGVLGVAGEERGFHAYTHPDCAHDIAQRWKQYLGDKAWVLTKEQARESAIFGELSDQSFEAIGDVMCFARSDVGIVDSRVLSPHALNLRGVHGSFTADEMHIPWIVEVV